MRNTNVTLELQPSELGRVFCVPTVEVDCSAFPDVEDAACNAFLLWQSEYPDYIARLHVPDDTAAEKALNRRLFRP